MKRLLLLLTIVWPFANGSNAKVNIDSLLSRMTVEEKMAQLMCPMGWTYSPETDTIGMGMLWATFRADPWTGRTLENGLNPKTAAQKANELQRHAVEHTRLGIPLLLAEEAPHGHMAIGTTVFPTGLGMGATFSTQLAERMGEVIAKEIRLQGGHISYGPVLDLARDPRWSRTEETMGEDPVLVGQLGAAIVRGMGGGKLNSPNSVIATLKHLVAYGSGEDGQNGAATQAGKRELLQTYLPPFRDAIDAGALSVMTAYGAVDGIPCTANPWLLNDILRRQWGFRGFVVSDLYSINVLHNTLHVADSPEQAQRMALQAGVDVDLGKSKIGSTFPFVGLEKELDAAVRRVLQMKADMGLFEHPYVDEELTREVHCPAHIETALEVARASITLLKNNGTLPIPKGKRLAVVGPNADDIYAQLGDYTAPQPEGKVITVRKGLETKGFTLTNTKDADLIIAVVGGSSSRYLGTEYASTGAAIRGKADSGEGLDRCTLDLPKEQQALLDSLHRMGKPLVVVYIEGRPLLKNWADQHADALLTAYYPGEQGGNAVADVLTGDYNPAGRLPISVPRNVGQLPVYYNRQLPATHDYVEGTASPLYPFGYGLSYTTFDYSGLDIKAIEGGNSGWSVSFTITNSGNRDGEEVPQLYVRDDISSVVLPERQLRCFDRISIPAHQSRKVTFHLTPQDLALINSDLQEVVEPGTFTLLIGTSSTDIRLQGTIEVKNRKEHGDIHEQSTGYEWPDDPKVVEKLHHWQDQKFGILLHWGLYAVPGIVESWSICDENWITRDTTQTYDQYKHWYWGLADSLCPTRFNPDQWAEIAEEAGMKYMLFTTKHHDGFCLFDSWETDFNIARHAFAGNPQSDVLQHVLSAFRNRGFMTGTYFSKPDWHSQLYWWDVYPTKGRNVNYPIRTYPERWKKFQQFTYNQIEEILSRYGSVDILWLDGGWVCHQNNQDIDMPRIAQMARTHQPGLIIVDRTIRGPYENYQTPERTIPEKQLPYPWESCIPLSDDWGWVPHPRWKSAKQVVNTLVEVVAKGGNLVLGIGPTAEGLIQPEAADRLRNIGLWLKQNGKAIYNSAPTTHYHDGNTWFTASKDGKHLYAIHTITEGEPLPSTLTWHGNVPRKGSSMRLLATGQRLRWSVLDNEVTISLPRNLKAESFAIEMEK